MNPNIHVLFFMTCFIWGFFGVSLPQFVCLFACLYVPFHMLEQNFQQDYFNKDVESLKTGEMREMRFK